MDRFLVSGGAGFVGSHLVDLLVQHGAEVVVIDNLQQGHRAALPKNVSLIEANIGDAEAVDAIFATGSFQGVFHFAALSLVGESMRQPMRYLRENVVGGLVLIDACIRHGIKRFVLSSTANLFSEHGNGPIAEDGVIAPGSPYGESKLIVERALYWADICHGMRSACLRYFNAAGADPTGRIGEDHDPETHLIPLVIDAALGRRPALTVFGEDYPTPDGTCVRDYVHVSDLANAHVSALGQLDHRSVTYNLGTGQGYSVRDVVHAVEQVSGRRIPVQIGPRRAGDPPSLVAASGLIRSETGWSPRFTDLRSIVQTAFDWRLAHPLGYDDRPAEVDPLAGAGRYFPPELQPVGYNAVRAQ